MDGSQDGHLTHPSVITATGGTDIMAAGTDTSTEATGRLPGGRYGLRQAIRMEWIKARTLRSTWWMFAVMVAAMVALAIVVLRYYPSHWAHLSHADKASFDPTNDGFTGLAVGQLIMAALGVLLITSEYSSGMIRTTLVAVPRRPLLLAAKAAVAAGLVLLVGEIGAFATFLAGQSVLTSPAPHATLGQPGVLRAVLLAGVYLALMALMGVGIGAIVRRSAAGIAAIAGLVFVLPPITLAFPDSTQHAVQRFLPEIIAENSLTAVKQVPYSLSAGAGLGMLALYTAILLGAGGLLLARRDA
jgi:ABC-2 type transport system permease protein